VDVFSREGCARIVARLVDAFSRQEFFRMILTRVVGGDLNCDQIVRVCKDTGRSCVFNKDSFMNMLVFCTQDMLYCHAKSVHSNAFKRTFGFVTMHTLRLFPDTISRKPYREIHRVPRSRRVSGAVDVPGLWSPT